MLNEVVVEQSVFEWVDDLVGRGGAVVDLAVTRQRTVIHVAKGFDEQHQLSSVDLSTPDSPMMGTDSPGVRVSETCSNKGRPNVVAKRLVRGSR